MTGERREDLAAYLSHARWFGGKGRPFALTDAERLGGLEDPEGAEPHVVVDLVHVEFGDAEGGTDLYQMPLAMYRDAQPQLEHAFVGWWEDRELGFVHAYDAVHDRLAMQRWLDAFAATEPGAAAGPGAGPGTGLRFHRVAGHELDTEAHSTLFSGEQSNSSVAFGGDSLMKIFRKVTPGENPDITVHEILTRAGSEHVAALYGWQEAATADGVIHLAMLQQFLRTASDGWDLAQASVRNLFAEADLHADEVGGDFAGESARLGEAVAEVHATLREELGTGVVSASTVADTMAARLEAALPIVPGLADHESSLRAAFAGLADLGDLEVQRVHGDLHLGQTLRTVKGWKIVDFEGEPAKPLAQRVLPDSRWRDVAGMLRSFDYAARVVELTIGGDNPASTIQLRFRAAEWVDRNREAFVAAYAGNDLSADELVVLRAYVADKAVYEAVYEARNRPTWVSIPLDALARWRAT